MNILAPSILSADFSDLKNDILKVEEAGATYLHIDVMDGHFVPSISFGMPIIKAIRPHSNLVFDVHLMISEPEKYIQDFRDVGADIITVHQESCLHLDRVIHQIKDSGAKVGVSLNPATPIETIHHILPELDMVLLMSVNPGFGGQNYIDYVTSKIGALSQVIKERNLNCNIEVDGGIKLDNVQQVIKAGANVIVAGSAIFNGDIFKNTKAFLEQLR